MTAGTTTTRSLILPGLALAALAWLVHQPAFAHDTLHKRLAALVAVATPFLVLDVVLGVRKRRRARPRSSPAPARAKSAARW